MDLESLLKLIPQRSESLESAIDPPIGIRLPELEPGKVFVKPRLLMAAGYGSPEPDSAPRVALISASAAVGKSMLAAYLARQTKNPYWDLGRFAMGSGFFSGTLSSAYGVSNYAAAIDDMQNGRLCLVLDAADEAIVASTTTNYVAALANLAEIVRDTRSPEYAAIIFGRPETIQDTYFYLDEASVPCAVYEVAYFGQNEAKEFVSLQVDAAEDTVIDELSQFIETFFDRVKEAFGADSWDVVGSFLGYAPVLDSMALFYCESDNPYKELKHFISDGGKTWSLIAEMLESVLERETEKFATSFGGADEAKRAFARSAYDSATQVRWLLSDEVRTLTADPDLDLVIRDEWLDDLEHGLHQQFEDHPFLKSSRGEHAANILLGFTSVAFRDYVLAKYLMEPDSDYLEVLASYWTQPDVVPSPMLSRFIRATVAEKPDLTLAPECLMFLFDSHAEQITGTEPTVLYLEWGDTDDLDDLDDLEMRVTWRQVGAKESQSCLVSSPSAAGEVELCRSISMAAIDLPGATVRVGLQLGESDLGPSAAVRCGEFVAQCAELHLNGTAADGRFDALVGTDVRCEKVSGGVRRITGARSQFTLHVPTAPHPWKPFCLEERDERPPSSSDLLFTALAVRRIALWFSRGGTRFSREKLDTIMAKGRASRAVFDFLMSTNRIWIDGPFYRLDLGFSIASVQSLDLGDTSYRDLIAEVQEAIDGR